MVDIVRRGKLPDKRLVDFTCQNCKSELRATVGEAVSNHLSHQGAFLTFSCPVCRKQTCIEDTGL